MADKVATIELTAEEYDLLVTYLEQDTRLQGLLGRLRESREWEEKLESFNTRIQDITQAVERVNEISGNRFHWMMLHLNSDAEKGLVGLSYTSDGEYYEIIKDITPDTMRNYIALHRNVLENFDFWDLTSSYSGS